MSRVRLADSDKSLTIEGSNNKLSTNQVRFSDTGTVNVIEPSETGEAIKELNSDSPEFPGSKMTGIDLRTRLGYSEIAGIHVMDTLVDFGYLDSKCTDFTKRKKRLNVSLAGKGRAEIVDISGGRREQQQKRGFLGGLFGGNQQNNGDRQ